MRCRSTRTSTRAKTIPALTAAACLCSAAVLGQPVVPAAEDDESAEPLRRYAVELILFRYGDGVSAGTEVFVPDPGAADPAVPVFGDARGVAAETGAAVPDDPAAVPVFGDLEPPPAEPLPEEPDLETLTLIELPTSRDIELRVLDAEELTMGDAYERLERLDAYRPVLWSGWTQLAREETVTTAIDLRRLGRLPLAFDGELKLYLSRFLHLVVDLSLSERLAAAPAADPLDLRRDAGRFGFDAPPPVVAHRIHEDRIVNNGHLRYFDHPKFGLLAQVTRLEEIEEEPTDESVLLPGGEPIGTPR